MHPSHSEMALSITGLILLIILKLLITSMAFLSNLFLNNFVEMYYEHWRAKRY